MSLQWCEINIWPEREIVDYHSPADFKHQFPRIRLIFDGTECPIKKPKASTVQQITFSKNCNTAKVFIGVTPGGQVSYVSPAYGESIIDLWVVGRGPNQNM